MHAASWLNETRLLRLGSLLSLANLSLPGGGAPDGQLACGVLELAERLPRPGAGARDDCAARAARLCALERAAAGAVLQAIWEVARARDSAPKYPSFRVSCLCGVHAQRHRSIPGHSIAVVGAL